MSIVGEILEELWNSEVKYKGMTVNLFGIPRFSKYSKSTLQHTVKRLEKNGFITKELNGLVLSKEGRNYVKKRFDSLKQFETSFKNPKKKDLIVMFDVPVHKRAERDWLRWHLKKFNYVMIQRSVWVGPSPLPKDFLDYLEEIKLRDSIKTFKLSNPYKEEDHK